LFIAAMITTFLALIILPFLGFSVLLLTGLIFIVPAYRAAKQLASNLETVREIIPAQAQTLLSFLLFSVGTGIGFLLDQVL
jgi:hypothetical protein